MLDSGIHSQLGSTPVTKTPHDNNKKIKKLPSHSIVLNIAGNIAVPKCDQSELKGVFHKYEQYFAAMANMEQDQRFLLYLFTVGLSLTALARREKNRGKRRVLFDLKNQVYFKIANSDLRKKVKFRYLQSDRVRVLEYCGDCQEKNKSQENIYKWNYCQNCQTDSNYYNILSMTHKFPQGSATLFLSQDRIEKIKGINLKDKSKLKNSEELIKFHQFRFSSKNLDVFDLDSVISFHNSLVNSSTH